MIGPFADINMFNMVYMSRAPEIGINPADIMRPCVMGRSTSPASTNVNNSPLSADQLPSTEVLSSIVALLSNTANKENQIPQEAALPRTTDKQGVFRHSVDRAINKFASPMNISRHETDPFSSEEPPFTYRHPTPTPAAHRSPLVGMPLQSNEPPTSRSVPDYGFPDFQRSPVLNAHLGIDLEKLVDKANKYRTRFPGRPIDKKWLMAYAGKLTERGELLDDYRCYVNGCTQKNKRRDHILVHVGSHVDQRLFVCSVW